MNRPASRRTAVKDGSISFAAVENNLQGIALLCLTMFFVALTELLAKYLSQGFAVPQIVWARYVLLLVLALILFWPRYGPSLLRSRRPGLQWVRALQIGRASCRERVCQYV